MASLHELLQHFEENHAQSAEQRNNANRPSALPDSKAAMAANTANALRQSAQQDQSTQQVNPVQSSRTPVASQPSSTPVTPKVQKAQPATVGVYPTAQHHPSLDMDAVQDMEMDDVDYNPPAKPNMDDHWGISNQSRISQGPR
ncbi:MAG: hypothetical protein L6R41_003012, partial [Letrouitia leprolyta]